MNRHLLDARVWAPALAGILCFLPRALPTPMPARPARAVAIDLPALRGLPPPAAAQQFEIDGERSSLHALVGGAGAERLVAGALTAGRLRCDAHLQGGMLELQGELAATRWSYRAEIVESAHTDLPGVQRLTFVGALHAGDATAQQTMQLWLCSLPGQPPRLLGRSRVRATLLGLCERRWFGLLPADDAVTLGLDLAWRRPREH